MMLFEDSYHEDSMIIDSHPENEYGMLHISLGALIGKGAFATIREGSIVEHPTNNRNIHVHLTQSRSNIKPESIAVKCIRKGMHQTHQAELNQSIHREIEALKRCTSLDCVCQMYFVCDTPTIYYVGLEFCSNGDLYGHLSIKGIEHSATIKCIGQIAKALTCLHNLDIVYHDLKPENICTTWDGQIKLVDFGMAFILSEQDYNPETKRREIISEGGTIEYCAPEVYKRQPHSFEADWWSFGILSYELLSGQYPYPSSGTVQDKCNAICAPDVDFTRNVHISPGSMEEQFLMRFLVKNPKHRFGYHHPVDASELLQHAFFQCTNKKKVSMNLHDPSETTNFAVPISW